MIQHLLRLLKTLIGRKLKQLKFKISYHKFNARNLKSDHTFSY
jgi:hypothetical protein